MTPSPIDTVIRRFAWITVLAFVVGFVLPAARQVVSQHTSVLVQP